MLKLNRKIQSLILQDKNTLLTYCWKLKNYIYTLNYIFFKSLLSSFQYHGDTAATLLLRTCSKPQLLPGFGSCPKAWRCPTTMQLLLLPVSLAGIYICISHLWFYPFIRVSLCYVRLVKWSKRADMKYINREQTSWLTKYLLNTCQHAGYFPLLWF